MATARLTRPATRAALPLVLPGDVRLMNLSLIHISEPTRPY